MMSSKVIKKSSNSVFQNLSNLSIGELQNLLSSIQNEIKKLTDKEFKDKNELKKSKDFKEIKAFINQNHKKLKKNRKTNIEITLAFDPDGGDEYEGDIYIKEDFNGSFYDTVGKLPEYRKFEKEVNDFNLQLKKMNEEFYKKYNVSFWDIY